MVANKMKVKRYVGVYFYQGVKGKCYYISFTVKGRMRWEKIGWDHEGVSAADANNIRMERMRQIRLGEILPDPKEEKESAFTFGDAFEQYLKSSIANGNRSYKNDLGIYNTHFVDWANIPLSDITIKMIEQKKQGWVTEGKAPGTIKNLLVFIRKVINRAKAMGYWTCENPIDNISMPKFNNNRQRFLTQDEARGLLAALQDRGYTSLYLMALISLSTGMRRGEISRIKGMDVDLKNGIIITDGKGGDNQKVYMGRALCEKLGEYKLAPTQRLFEDDDIYRTFMEVVDGLGLNEGADSPKYRVTFHTLRHTFASWLAQEGVSLFVIKELMRHSSIEMTMRYAHLIPDTKRDAVDRINLV